MNLGESAAMSGSTPIAEADYRVVSTVRKRIRRRTKPKKCSKKMYAF